MRAAALQLVGLLVVVVLIGRYVWWLAAAVGLIAVAVGCFSLARSILRPALISSTSG